MSLGSSQSTLLGQPSASQREEEVGLGDAADVASLLNPVVEFPVPTGRSMPSLEVFEMCVDVVLRNVV